MIQSVAEYWTSSPTVQEWEWVRAYYEATYILWGVAWLLVSFHYAVASYSSWLEQNGQWRHVFRDFFAPLEYVFCNIGNKNQGTKDGVVKVPRRYTIGHYLRFSIFLGALAPVFIGLVMFSFDKSEMIRVAMFINLLAMFISICGASGHVLIAYNSRPRAWSNFVLGSALWMIVAPILFYMYH